MIEIISLLVFCVNNVLGDYCEFGQCEGNQYCCGENKCCDKTNYTFIWAGIFVVILALAITAGLRYFVRKKNLAKDYRYQLVPDQSKPEES